MLETVDATRYVTPLREGGSLPAIVEASDCGMYVLKFRAAGQGPLALVAEVVAAGIGKALGLRIPDLVLIDVDEALGRNEPDEEIRDLLRASVGTNLGIDYLPGSVMFDRAAKNTVDRVFASELVWFDALITNVDRTARNPNLLVWHRRLHPIDHGAAIYFHHNWQNIEQMARSRFSAIRDHVLLPWADSISEAGERFRPIVTEKLLRQVLDSVPRDWLPAEAGDSEQAQRDSYVNYFLTRLEVERAFVEEAVDARTRLF